MNFDPNKFLTLSKKYNNEYKIQPSPSKQDLEDLSNYFHRFNLIQKVLHINKLFIQINIILSIFSSTKAKIEECKQLIIEFISKSFSEEDSGWLQFLTSIVATFYDIDDVTNLKCKEYEESVFSSMLNDKFKPNCMCTQCIII